jgi:RimJ/RimL family protein N-acetyltransferase
VSPDQKSELNGPPPSTFTPASSSSALKKACWRLLCFWRSASETLRRDGFLVFLWQILVRCTAPLGSVALLSFYERDLNQAVPEIEAHAEVAVTVASESDIDLIAAQIASDFHGGQDALPAVLSKIRCRLRLGQICFVAKIGSAVVHYTWIAFRGSPSVEDRFITLKDHEAYLAWAYTPEAWRGKHIYPAVDSHVLRYLQEAGYRQVLTFTKTDNKSSRKGLERAGWRQVGQVLTLRPRWRGHTWIWYLSAKSQSERFLVHPSSELLKAFQTLL